MKYMTFKCPSCGSRELMRMERALICHRESRIVNKGGTYLAEKSEVDDLLSKGLAGLQCAQCRYPDERRDSFRWKRWSDVETAGCLTPDPDDGKEKVACTICSLDGRVFRTHVLLPPGEGLPAEMRQHLLEHALHGKPGVVLCDRDPAEEVSPLPGKPEP